MSHEIHWNVVFERTLRRKMFWVVGEGWQWLSRYVTKN